MQISSSPLQGITDDVFRSLHHQVYGGVDEYIGPYIRLENHKEPKKSQLRDATSSLNKNIHYIPQVLSHDSHLILKEMDRLLSLGHQEVNWNLGCPYPMVTKRNMGAGLLNNTALVNDILSEISKHKIKLSIKCRLGLEHDQDILALIEVFNQYNLKEVIIHARTAKQMYKGKANPEKFKALIPLSKHPLVYNGDIQSVEDMNQLQDLFQGDIKKFMLGRGLIMKPYLALNIKEQEQSVDNALLKEFHNKLIEQYLGRYQEHQLIPKMRALWEYFAHSFSDPNKVFKLIKKSKSWKTYTKNTNLIFNQYLIDG